MRQKLLARGFNPGDIEEALAALESAGLQSDARYTRAYIRNRLEKGYGPIRLARELRERGITEELSERTLAEMDVDWDERLQALRHRKFGEQAPGNTREKAKQFRFLQYRGFTSGQIHNAFKNSTT